MANFNCLFVCFVLVCFATFIPYASTKATNDFFCVDDTGSVNKCPNNVRPEKFPNSHMIAYARFSNRMKETGWMELEIVTNKDVDDDVQAYYAGVLEGKITSRYIDSFRKNMLRESTIPRCSKFKDFIAKNLEATKQKIHFRSGDTYWLNVRSILHQLAGMDDGHRVAKDINKAATLLKPHFDVDPCGVIMLNLYDELGDFEEMMEQQRTFERKDKCSALIKLVHDEKKDKTEVYVNHATWSNYYSMLRIMKRYTFNWQHSTSKTMVFPSYPGNVYSTDDYYLMSNGLVVQETTLENHNASSYKGLTPDSFVFEFIRTIISNRLADVGATWAGIFSVENSGSYSNQFMVVDYKRKDGNEIRNGFLTIVEQMPHYMIYKDKTQHLLNHTYWASYNIPYFDIIYKVSNYDVPFKKYGNLYSYDKAPRAQIFARDHNKVVNVSTAYNLMRYNDFQHDPLSYCEGCLPSKKNSVYAIAARDDLNDQTGTYQDPAIRYRLRGAVDVKITSGELVKDLQMIAESGPTHQGQQPFSWATAKGAEFMDHDDLPTLWNFRPVLTKWNDQQFPEFEFDL